MRSMTYFIRNDDASMRKNFTGILEIKRNYVPDPALWTPRVIQVFNEVKTDYLKNNPEITAGDNLKPKSEVKFNFQEIIGSATIKNLFLPGLGQFEFGETQKGILFSAASALNIGALIYFILDANKKENNYYNENDPSLIPQRYDEYNNAYKIRNTLLISYAVIWLYSQIDLLFMNGKEPTRANQTVGLIQFYGVPGDCFKVGFALRF
jgi:hypothetical protein